MPEGVFACEDEAGRLVLRYANLALCELLGVGRDIGGRRLLELLDGRLDAAARAEIDNAVAARRQVWVRLREDHVSGLSLTIKPASVPGAWVGAVRRVSDGAVLSIRRAVLTEHPHSDVRDAPSPCDLHAVADVYAASEAETATSAVLGAPAPLSAASTAEREAAVVRALDAAGITWLEQDLATGALTIAGRRLNDTDTALAGRGRGVEPLVYPADLGRRRAALEALMNGSTEELYCAYRVRDASGNWQWMLETGHLPGGPARAERYMATLQPVPDRAAIEIRSEPVGFSAEQAAETAERFKLPGLLAEIHHSPSEGLAFTFLGGRLAALGVADIARAPQTLLDRLDPHDRAELESRCALAAAEACSWECAFGYEGADGTRRSAYLRAEPVPHDGEGTLFRGVILEDTERRRVEQALADSERRFRQLYESAPFMMMSVGADGALLGVNAQWAAKLGRRRLTVGSPAARVFAPGYEHLADTTLLAADGSDGFTDRECRLVSEDGRELECHASARVERDDDGRLAGVHFLIIDVTDRNRAMQALKDSEARFRAIVHDQTEAICRFDTRGRIRFANEAYARATGLDPEAPDASSWFDLLDELQAKAVRRELARLTPQEPLLQRELRMTHLGGRLFQWTIRAFFDDAGALTGFQAVGRDMEELQKLEAQIREIGQREQRRIGHDLHDGLGQELTGVSLMLRKLELDAAAEAPGLGERVASVRRMIDQCLATTRSLARGLSPVELERGGLSGALEQLAANVEEMYGVAVAVECRPEALVHDEETATQLYRIAQEATSNAAKHADPVHVTIRLLRRRECLVLEIEDDGAGLPAAAEGSGGLGLKIMRYRANILGASIEFMSEPGLGTLVRCQLQRPAGRQPGERR